MPTSPFGNSSVCVSQVLFGALRERADRPEIVEKPRLDRPESPDAVELVVEFALLFDFMPMFFLKEDDADGVVDWSRATLLAWSRATLLAAEMIDWSRDGERPKEGPRLMRDIVADIVGLKAKEEGAELLCEKRFDPSSET